MFDDIAPKYDFLNHALSFNIDRSWRRKLIRSVLRSNPEYVLDMASGTGDVAGMLHRKGRTRVVGMDISDKMLDIARRKYPEVEFVNGSADMIDFPDDTFDAVTISFGIRNFDKRPECIVELFRVLKPGGTISILEFSIPENRLWKGIYSFYFRNVLPAVGKMISKNDFAYRYLPESAFDFPQREAFCNELRQGGFGRTVCRQLTGGVACLYTAVKQGD